jgi:hypothetical protein
MMFKWTCGLFSRIRPNVRNGSKAVISDLLKKDPP